MDSLAIRFINDIPRKIKDFQAKINSIIKGQDRNQFYSGLINGNKIVSRIE